MNAILTWIKAQWSDPATHAWLVALGGTLTAWSNGSMTDRQALAAALISAIAIVIPPSKPAKP